MNSVHRTIDREPWSQSGDQPPSQHRRHDGSSVGQQGSPCVQANVPSGHPVERRPFLGPDPSPDNLARPSSRWVEVSDQVGPQDRPVELSASAARSYLVLLQEPDQVHLLPSRLPGPKPRPLYTGDRLSNYHRNDPIVPRDGKDAVVLDNAERKSVRVHDAAAKVKRLQSHKARIQQVPDKHTRRSDDSGYFSVDRLRRSISSPRRQAWDRNPVASSSSGDLCSSASLKRQCSLISENGEQEQGGSTASPSEFL